MIMSFRTYLLIGIVVGGILFLVSTFFGPDIVRWAEDQQVRASLAGVSAIGTIVGEPLIFVIGTRPWGPIMGGLFWPATILWPVLVLLWLLIIEGVGVASDVEGI